MSGNIHEECGVFGIYRNAPSDVAHSVYFGLYALQHRGQESCGIVVNDRGVFKAHKGLGLVNEVFNERVLSELGQGRIAVGHVRYSTTGNVNTANCQPMTVRHVKGALAIAHNGNLINALDLRRQYELKGAIFHSTSDTEVISYAITEARLETGSIQEAVEKAMYKIKGAYSLAIMSPEKSSSRHGIPRDSVRCAWAGCRRTQAMSLPPKAVRWIVSARNSSGISNRARSL